MQKELKLIERREIHTFEWGELPHKVQITTINGAFAECTNTISAPKTREDWILFALIAEKIEELTVPKDEWQVRRTGEQLPQLPSNHPNADDLIKSFDEKSTDASNN